MAVQPEGSTEEIRRLRRCINDLVSVLALPAIWAGGGPSHVVGNLLDALVSMLNLDFIYARLGKSGGSDYTEMIRIGPALERKPQPQEIGERLRPLLIDDPEKIPPVVDNFFNGRNIALVSLQLGLHGEMGVLVAGSRRSDFPQQTERLLLNVAANQAAIGLHEANVLSELDHRVAQRTAELASANKRLHEAGAALEKAFDEIERSEAKLRQVIDAIPTIAWCNLPDGPNEFLNKSWHEYTGLSPEQSHGWGWQIAFHSDDLPALMKRWGEMLVTGEPGEIEARIRRHDGVYRWFLIRAEPFLEQGELVRWYGTSTDIDDRKRTEEALNKARAELAHVAQVTTLSTLTASIAHEVNQPLSGIVTNAGTCLRMLDANPPNLEGARETARRTIRDGKRASDVITRLRTLYSKRELLAEPMDLNEAAREVISLSLSELERNRVALRQELAQELPSVMGDRIQIQQVILNLIRNGSDAMSAVDNRPRELTVKTDLDEAGAVRLSVKDSGVGIDPEIENKLFEPFYTTKSEGMGIGLSVSRSIMESHRGRLWVVRNDGPGATFLFSIPCGTNTKVQ
jgi:PAS domain S-box-containing protein